MKVNLNYIIGVVGAIVVCLFGMVTTVTLRPEFEVTVDFGQLINFFDPASIMITVGCTCFVVVASVPGSLLKAVPKHFKVILGTKLFDPMYYIDQLVELAQIARKDGLLSLEERALAEEDPFFQKAIMLIVDAYDADKIRNILETDIENTSARHEDAAAMYDRASSVAPAFGMVGTLVGLINMLRGMDMGADSQSTLGSSMGTALITTLYGCIMAHIFFGPVANLLRIRDGEEVLCKMIIVEGVMSIQAGENPKFLRERLMTYMEQNSRDEETTSGEEGEESGKKKKKKKEKKKKDEE